MTDPVPALLPSGVQPPAVAIDVNTSLVHAVVAAGGGPAAARMPFALGCALTTAISLVITSAQSLLPGHHWCQECWPDRAPDHPEDGCPICRGEDPWAQLATGEASS